MKVKLLEWDSCFFNKKIGEVVVEGENQLPDKIKDFDLLYVKQKIDAPILINKFKQTYSESKVVFSKKVSSKGVAIDNNINSAFKLDLKELYLLAFESGRFSRFRLDPNFLMSEFEALYIEWIDNAFKKTLADDILVYKEHGVIKGFVTFKKYKDYAMIGLIAVRKEQRGRGIGKKMLHAVEMELHKCKIKELRIPTQLQNKGACEFYAILGYKIIDKTIIKHFWKI